MPSTASRLNVWHCDGNLPLGAERTPQRPSFVAIPGNIDVNDDKSTGEGDNTEITAVRLVPRFPLRRVFAPIFLERFNNACRVLASRRKWEKSRPDSGIVSKSRCARGFVKHFVSLGVFDFVGRRAFWGGARRNASFPFRQHLSFRDVQGCACVRCGTRYCRQSVFCDVLTKSFFPCGLRSSLQEFPQNVSSLFAPHLILREFLASE